MCPSEMFSSSQTAAIDADRTGYACLISQASREKPRLNQTLAAYYFLMRLGRKFVAKHWKAAHRFRLGRFVLENVPMLRKLAIFKPDDIGGDPRFWAAVTRKAPMGDYVISFGEDQVIFITESVRKPTNEIE
jgi:hypothetical protein